MLQDRVSSSPVDADRRSGVAHLEFSVLHCSVGAMSQDARLSGVVPNAGGGGEFIATSFRELSKFLDSLGVIGEGGSGDLKVVRAGPRTRGVVVPRASSDAGVGGKRAGNTFLGKGAAVYGRGDGDRIRQCFRPGVGVSTSISGTVGVCVLGQQGVPSTGPPVRTGVCG